MNILIFIAVIVALILVHEIGHFIAAKLAGMRVDEFGLGYPPRAAVLGHIGETVLSLNWLPFGGFVKIYGEDSESDMTGGSQTSSAAAFNEKNRLAQAFVLVAGVAMNLLFAYALITGALVAGTPRALTPSEITHAHNLALAVANVLPSSPAAEAGLASGDSILFAEDGHYQFSGTDPAQFSAFVERAGGNATIALSVRHVDGSEETLFAQPIAGLIPQDPARYVIGVEVATIGVVPLSLGAALTEGATLTWGVITLTAAALLHFFSGVFTLSANFSQVAGPVGIAGAVGAASVAGFGNLLSLVAVISINLALINLIPVPALDGGRLLFVAIEGIIRRPIKPSVARTMNSIGFALLILLMFIVTVHDIFRIVG